MHEVVIPAQTGRNVADRPAELTFRDDERIVEHRLPSAARRCGEVRDEIAKPEIKTPSGAVNTAVGSVDVRVVIPATQIDLDVPYTEVRHQNVPRRDARIAEPVVA